MGIFNKGEMYTIVADSETNFWVQRFADNRSVKRGVIGVTVMDKYLLISFRTKETRANINKELKNTFADVYNVRLGEYLSFVTKKEAR